MQTFTAKIVCPDCKGTGLYVGFAEKNGAAVECYKCGGTGAYNFKLEYEFFKERKRKDGIRRVFKSSFGFGHSSEDITTPEGKTIEFTRGGAAYEEWCNGKKPEPVKELYCPYLWEDQKIQKEEHPLHTVLYKSRCRLGTGIGCMITACGYFRTKEKCWEIYDNNTK